MENTIQDKIIDRSKLIYESNYTSIPNVIFDYWMEKLSPGEFKVLLCICRKTFGWHKTEDKISLRQIEKLTGLAKSGIVKMVSHLVDLKIVKKITSFTEHGDNAPNLFSIDVHSGYDPLLNSGGGSIHSGQGVVHSVDRGVVHSVDTQKKLYTKENISSHVDNACEKENCFSAGDVPLKAEKKIQVQQVKEKHITPNLAAKEAAAALFEKVDKKFDAFMLSEAKEAIENALKEYSEDVVMSSIEELNAKSPDSIRTIKGLFPHICATSKLKEPRKLIDKSQLEKRIQIAKCLERMSTSAGSFSYDEKKLYQTSGTLTKEYTFTGNDYFWEEKERFVREEANKRTAKHV